jgi:elongation factor P
MIQTKLRNIRTGSSFEHRFRSADTIERASLEQHEMEYMYSDGSHHHFMNTETYDQVALSDDDLGDAAQWLSPGLKIQAEFYEGARSVLIFRLAGIDGHANRTILERRDGV